MFTSKVKTEGRLLELLESENWEKVHTFLQQGHKLSRFACPVTLCMCMELGMLAVRKAPDFLVPLLIECIDLACIFPSSNSDFDCARVYYRPLLHNVCLDHKHESVALVLNQVGTEVARKEASRFDYVNLHLGDDKHSLSYDFLFTPIQTAWETFLVEDDFSQVTQHIDTLEDLYLPSHLNLLNLWMTSMYLLMAMDGKPINTHQRIGR